MEILRKLKALFRREPPVPSASPREPFVPSTPFQRDEPRKCPKCGSTNTTLRMTDWIIGHQVKDNGCTTFACVCIDCDHLWEYPHH